jgi:hypothetical protein
MAFSIVLLLSLLMINMGMLFLIQHWQGTSLLLGTGGSVLLLTYAAWFVQKMQKTRLDILKAVWVVGMASCILLLALRLPVLPVAGITAAAFWAMLLDFGYVTYLRPRKAN